jgi:hypothetical protein
MQMFTYFFIKGGTIRCMRTAVKYAQEAFDNIDTALSEEPIEAPAPPVSCAAILAQKIGASDVHQAMVAGLAGGIGLCGGGCGALGAAIWFFEMDRIKEGAGRPDFENPRALDAIDKFTTCTGNEFECSKIVGRNFENVDDHAAYLRDGGCSKIIELLAV